MQNNNSKLDIDKLQLASYQKRILSFIIDDFVITFLMFLIFWNQINSTNSVEEAIFIINNAVLDILILKFLYQAFFIWQYGATLGKFFTKTKVIDYDHFGKVSLKSAIIRSIARIISGLFFYIGFLISYFNSGRQTFHDKIAKTLVVNDYTRT